MAVHIYPLTLPQVPLIEGLDAPTPTARVRESPVEGVPKLRFMGWDGKPMVLPFMMTAAHLVTLENFVTVTLKATAPFTFPWPAPVDVRLLRDGGRLYRTSPFGAYWRVVLALEILP